jgi:hypothetical protein
MAKDYVSLNVAIGGGYAPNGGSARGAGTTAASAAAAPSKS